MKVFLERCRGRAVVTPTPIETTTTTAEPYAATVDQVPDVTEAITANSSAIAFPCGCCHKFFTTASNRKRHERTQHEPLLPSGPLSVTVISSSTTSATVYGPREAKRQRRRTELFVPAENVRDQRLSSDTHYRGIGVRIATKIKLEEESGAQSKTQKLQLEEVARTYSLPLLSPLGQAFAQAEARSTGATLAENLTQLGILVTPATLLA